MEETVETKKRVSSERAEEFELLKQRADMLGIKYSGNIGLDTLRAKVNERLEEKTLTAETTLDKAALRKKVKEEQLKILEKIRLKKFCPKIMKM